MQYRDLDSWNRARSLVKQVYESTSTFPKTEMFGLTSQMRRCAVSIPSNIAEGSGREGPKELSRFLHIARGSAYELETQVVLATDLGFLPETDANLLLDELGHLCRLLQGQIRSAQRRSTT
jgi:four helix bundle protein